ncbi:UNVERIFIED_CONTAM: hypothetical protein HDU68_010227 [Siphonaria sp. JEL0065]|nr:hypothetical protein HDU68_010227 [Siphonaria sp. JEL0065]
MHRYRVVGRGKNLNPSDLSIVVDAGWDTEAVLEGNVLLKVGVSVKDVRIQWFTETRWDSTGKLAKRPESAEYVVTRNSRVFQQLVQVVYDSPENIVPSPMGGSLTFPFKFNLPKNNMPPSFRTASGKIEYWVKCSILFQERGKLLRSTKEIEVPVIVRVPESAKAKLLQSPSHMTHHSPSAAEKIGFALQLPKRVLAMGDSVEVNLSIFSVPNKADIRSMNVTLLSIAHYVNADNRGANARSPRPLAEIHHSSFPSNINESNPFVQRMHLLVDPSLALASFESALISVKTFLRIQIILDKSDVPNVQHEIPIVVVSPSKHHQNVLLNTPTRPSPWPGYVPEATLLSTPRSGNLAESPLIGTPRSSASTGHDSTDHEKEFSILPEPGIPIPPIVLPKRNHSLKTNPLESSPKSQQQEFSYLLSQLDAMDISHGAEEHSSMIAADSAPSSKWSIDMVGEWLSLQGVPPTIVETFAEQQIDGTILVELSESDLRDELGVETSMRQRILQALDR